MVLKYSKKQLIIDSFFLTNRINDLIYHICLYYVSLLHLLRKRKCKLWLSLCLILQRILHVNMQIVRVLGIFVCLVMDILEKKPSNQFQSHSLDLLKIHSTNHLYFRCILFLNRNLCLPYRCASIKSSSNLMELYPVSACQFRAAESLLWQLRSSTRLLIGSFQKYSHLIGQSP